MTLESVEVFCESSYPLGLYAIKSQFTSSSIFVGKNISLRATLQAPESLVSSLKPLRKQAKVFDPNICIEADEMNSELIVKNISTQFPLSVNEQASILIAKKFFLFFPCLHQLGNMMAETMSEYLLSQKLRQ